MARIQKAPSDLDDRGLPQASELIAITHLLARQAARDWLTEASDDVRLPGLEMRPDA
jgi:hypothetical protein